MKSNILILLVGIMAITGCYDKDQNNKTSSPTAGRLIIGIDESLRPFADAEIQAFSYYYTNAYITPLYLPEKQVIEKLLANEIQTGIICRDLYDDEMAYIKAKYGHSPVSVKLAEDAIVPIVNNSNPINDISCDELKKILSGEITNWEQIYPVLKEKDAIIVVMTESSSINRHFFNSNDSPARVKSYALSSTPGVIDYVKQNRSALGILGGSWFYQKGGSYADVKLLGYRKDKSEGDNPEQDLVREIFAVTHEPFTGLGTGFISFLTDQKGQLVISKSGMTPYKPIEHDIKIIGSF